MLLVAPCSSSVNERLVKCSLCCVMMVILLYSQTERVQTALIAGRSDFVSADLRSDVTSDDVNSDI